jgi:hypothetical protein
MIETGRSKPPGKRHGPVRMVLTDLQGMATAVISGLVD